MANLSEAVAAQLRTLIPWRGDEWRWMLVDAGATLKALLGTNREIDEVEQAVAGHLLKEADRLGSHMAYARTAAAELARLLVQDFWLGECAGSLSRWPKAFESLTEGVMMAAKQTALRGRPPKEATETRKVRTYYATDIEYAAMQAKAEAAGTDLSGLIRRAILGHE